MPPKRKKVLTKDDYILLDTPITQLTEDQIQHRRGLQNLLSSRRSRKSREIVRETLPNTISSLTRQIDELQQTAEEARAQTASNETTLALACAANALLDAVSHHHVERDDEISTLITELRSTFAEQTADLTRTTRSATQVSDAAVGEFTASWMTYADESSSSKHTLSEDKHPNQRSSREPVKRPRQRNQRNNDHDNNGGGDDTDDDDDDDDGDDDDTLYH